MRKTTFKPKVTTVLQITAGQTLDAVIVDDKVFIEYPMPEGITIGGGTKETLAPAAAVDEVIEKAREAKKVETVAKKVAEAVTKKDGKVYTEEELMDVEAYPIKALTKICSDRGIQIPAEGKNTNKKLRLLILEAQDADFDEKEVAVPAKKPEPVVEEDEVDEDEDDRGTLIKLLTDFDEVEIDEKQLLKGLIEFGYDKKDAQGIIDDFNENTEVEIDSFVDSLLSDDEEEVDEEEEEEEEVAPVKKGAKKVTAPKEKLVKIEALKVGDKVKVYFESEEEFFNGEVKSIGRGGKVTVDYEDETTDVLDAEENTEIFLLS